MPIARCRGLWVQREQPERKDQKAIQEHRAHPAQPDHRVQRERLDHKRPQGNPGTAGAAGAAGPPGVVAATAPIQYDGGTQTVSIDLSNIAPKSSPVFTGDPQAPTPATV